MAAQRRRVACAAERRVSALLCRDVADVVLLLIFSAVLLQLFFQKTAWHTIFPFLDFDNFDIFCKKRIFSIKCNLKWNKSSNEFL